MVKKIFVAAIIFLLMSRVEAGTWSPEMRIGLLSGVKQVSLKVSAPCVMINVAKGTVLEKIPAGGSVIINLANLKFNAIEIRPEKILLKDLRTTIDGKEYYGGVTVNKGKDSLTVINLVPLEEYLRGVVSKEMSPSFPLEALKAQTVAARSFGMKNRGRHVKDGYDLCSTTHCQVYDGVAEFDSVDKAIDETRGAVLTYKEKIADTNFHTDSGGMTASAEEVWGGSVPYLVAVKEFFTTGTPWQIKISVKDLNIGKVKSVKTSDKTNSGRVNSAQIIGSKETLELTGNEMRKKFSLPSTAFNIKIDGDEIIFTGFGSGHGVGMSQRGARTYALEGWSYEKILAHYYKGTKLKKLY